MSPHRRVRRAGRRPAGWSAGLHAAWRPPEALQASMARAAEVMQSRPDRRGGFMRISTMIRFTPGAEPQRLMDRVSDYARRIEAAGFPGIWVGDSLGRGRPTL